jgi:site-specific DNA recombinase
MVKNPLYRGLRRYKSSRGVIERPVPAIVDTQTWERAQQQLAKNKALPKHGTMDAQLRGLIQCGVCGRGYVTAHNSKGSRFYRCGTTTVPRQHIAQGTCYGKSVLAEKLEDAVWKAVRELIEHPDRFLERAYQQLQTRIAQQPEQEVERQVLEVQVQAAEEKKNRLLKAYQKGWLNIEDTEAKLTEVETELKHFTLKLQALNTQRGLTRSYAERV